MSEAKQIFYKDDEKILAWSRHGVLWENSSEERIGSFYESDIFDRYDHLLANLKENKVFDIDGNLLGEIEGPLIHEGSKYYSLLVKGKEIGKSKHTKEMAAAVIALLGTEFSEST